MSSSFKKKEPKFKKTKPKVGTNLLTMHNDKVSQLSEEQDNLCFLESQQMDIIDQIIKLEMIDCKTVDQLRTLVELKEANAKIYSDMESIRNYTNMMDYYFFTSEILDDYFFLENEPSKAKMSIQDFFKSRAHEPRKATKKDLLEKYLDFVDDTYMKIQVKKIFNFCEPCDQEMILQKQQGVFICTKCGTTVDLAIDIETTKGNNPTLSDSQKYSVYQRKNHFKEWLNQIQAKESTEVPDEVFDLIKIELNKLRFYNLAELESETIRKILKKLNLTKYYENIFHIIFHLNGIHPPTLSRELEEKLLFYFKQIEEPFKLYKKKNRKNILRYSYILYKLCELLELDDFLSSFRLLKNRNKLKEQDDIWEAICKHLGWQFIPSI